MSEDGEPQPEPGQQGKRPRQRRKGARRSQAERVAESDRRLLTAALKLIGERGYRGTSVAAIGEAAGYSRGLVSERFGSKNGLLWALVKQLLRAWQRERVKQGRTGRQGFAALDDLLDSHKREVELNRGIAAFYLLMFEALGPTPELRPQFQELHRRFRSDIEQILREGIELGEMRADIDPAAQAAIVLGAQRGIAFQYLLERESFSLDAAYAQLKQQLRRSLAP